MPTIPKPTRLYPLKRVKNKNRSFPLFLTEYSASAELSAASGSTAFFSSPPTIPHKITRMHAYSTNGPRSLYISADCVTLRVRRFFVSTLVDAKPVMRRSAASLAAFLTSSSSLASFRRRSNSTSSSISSSLSSSSSLIFRVAREMMVCLGGRKGR